MRAYKFLVIKTLLLSCFVSWTMRADAVGSENLLNVNTRYRNLKEKTNTVLLQERIPAIITFKHLPEENEYVDLKKLINLKPRYKYQRVPREKTSLITGQINVLSRMDIIKIMKDDIVNRYPPTTSTYQFGVDGIRYDFMFDSFNFNGNGGTSNKAFWEPIFMKNKWQEEQGLEGGEGMQGVIDIDWNEKNTNVLYLVADTIRVYKSIDRGNSWFPVAKNLKANGGVSIVSDPHNENIVFFSGSRHSAGDPNLFSEYDGIYRSVDGGGTWEKVGETIHYKRYGGVSMGKHFLFDKDSFNGEKSMVIYAGAEGPNDEGVYPGVLKSVDGGDTWDSIALQGNEIRDLEWGNNCILASTNNGVYKIYPNNSVEKIGNGIPVAPFDLAVNSQNKQIVYVVAGNSVYKSVNGGKDFTEKSEGLRKYSQGSTGYPIEYRRITISKKNPDKLFASQNNLGGFLPFYSEDGGETWIGLRSSSSESTTEQFLFKSISFYWSRPVIFDPENENIAITKGDAIMMTFDGGKTWNYSCNGYGGARVNEIFFASEYKMLLSLTDFGLFITEDGGRTFSKTSYQSHRSLTTYNALSCKSFDVYGHKIVADMGSWSNKDILLSEDLGETWINVNAVGENFNFIKFNRSNPQIIYANKYISRNGGYDWEKVIHNGKQYNIKAMNPNDNDTVYAIRIISSSSKTQVIKSENAGQTWVGIGEIRTTNTESSNFVVDPFDENHLFIAAGNDGIYEYDGVNWSNIKNIFSDFNELGIYYIKFDPNKEGIIWAAKTGWAGHSDGIYVSKNGGKTWKNVINNLGSYNSFWSININPFNSDVYATADGIYKYISLF
ncbi:MAG: hypothetical protein JW715_06585 [Sedimentisphaerales bacterium]|nr:hypothetical protein [Sedimentisphaerales bacterium]